MPENTLPYGYGAYPVFIDSGAFTLYNKNVVEKGFKGGYEWFKTDEFIKYLDSYADFIKKHQDVINLYASVDVIFNPEMTWESQQYLEREHGLSPIPTIHFNTPLKWVKHYLDSGYEYIALGGLGQAIGMAPYVHWADEVFDYICSQPSREPVCKVHGFAMTSNRLMMRWPWYSVDSTSWLLLAAFGEIAIPPKKDGKWRFDVPYHTLRVSTRPAEKKGRGLKDTNTKVLNALFQEYIDEKGFVLGLSEFDSDGKEIVIEPGLCNTSMLRCEFNVAYFLDFVKTIPEWPWPFKLKNKGFGLRGTSL